MIRKPLSAVLTGLFVLSGFMSRPARAVLLFFDTGDQVAGVQGGPLDNSNPVVEVIPGQSAALFLWAVPDADNNKVIASLGHDVVISGTAAAFISATQYDLDNPTIGSNPRWNGVALAGALNAAGKLVEDQRAVFVPTAAPFVGGIGSGNLGIDPGHDANSGAVYLGRLDIQVDGAATVGTTAELRLAVSPLLIAQVTTGTWQAESVFFGFAGGGPEAATASGSVVGATSATADAVISVVAASAPTPTPGDCTGDGGVNLVDFATFATCFGLSAPNAVCDAGEFACSDLDVNGSINLVDFATFALNFGT